jgi:hypothetical protein
VKTVLCLAVGLTAFGLSLNAASAQARGSYLQSCVDVSQNGPFISAACRDRAGRFRPSRIDTRNCRGDIANNNGSLTCGGGGAAPPDRRRGGYDRDSRFDRRGYDDRRFEDRRRFDDEDDRLRRRRYDERY